MRLQLCIIFLCSWLTGCAASKPANFYLLSPIGEQRAEQSDLRIGIGPVLLPRYLDRPQIVQREGAVGLSVLEYDRWAEPLEDSLIPVLRVNIAQELGTLHVEGYPFKLTEDIRYQVFIDVLQFDYSTESQSVELHCRWLILDRENKSEVSKQVFHQEKPASTAIAEQIEKMNELLAELSSDIAGRLGSI